VYPKINLKFTKVLDECIVPIFLVYADRMFLLNVSKFLQPKCMTHPSRLIFIITSANFRYHIL